MDSVEHLPPSRLICPAVRIKHNKNSSRKLVGENFYLVIDSCYYFSNAGEDGNNSARSHHMSFLYWCNNKESKENFRCGSCECSTIGTTYYFCNECNLGYHKECVESPPLIKSLYHPKHHLQLLRFDGGEGEMICSYCESDCGSKDSFFFYFCSICWFSLDLVCAKKPTFLYLKRMHEHALNYFHRKNNLICDACGVVDNESLIYVCLQCDFIVHKRCIYLPFVIRISRHDHRLSFTFPHPSKELSCGVCRRKIDENYGKDSCVKGCTYEVHSKCTTRYDVWNRIDLEDEPEEEVSESINSFEVIGDEIIQHFSHSHHMRFENESDMLLYDKKITCQACTLPYYDGDDVYKCMELKCDFVLHEACANLPRKKHHMAHPYLLTLQVSDTKNFFVCNFCSRYSCGFRYVCSKWDISLDVRCATISEPFDHQCHVHPLFLTNETGHYKMCSVCGKTEVRPLNCMECGFVMCFSCATLPYKMRYEHDEHFLTLSYQENVSLINWCEVCEEIITDSPKWVYTCNKCEVTLHIECLLGKCGPYIKPVQNVSFFGKEIDIIPNVGLTRLICNACGRRCQDKTVFKTRDGRVYCGEGYELWRYN